MYKKVLANYQVPDRKAVLSAVKPIIRKYQVSVDSIPDPARDEYDGENSYLSRLRIKYDLQDVSASVNNILERKHDWEDFALELYLRLLYYITLALSLLIFMFRHTTAKTFFLSLLSATLLSIFTTIMIAATGGSDITFFLIYIFYYILFAVGSFAGTAIGRRKALTGISINLFMATTAFLPTIVLNLYYSIVREIESQKEVYDYTRFYNADLYLLLAEVTGFVLLMILVEPIFKKLYRKWYAAPEE